MEIIGLMAASWKLPIITPVATGSSLANKNNYKTLTRLAPGLYNYANFLIKIFRKYNWTDIAYIRSGSTYADLQEKSYLAMFKSAGITPYVLYHTGPVYNHESVLKRGSGVARGKCNMKW